MEFPLSLSDFADTLPIRAVKWKLQDNRQYSGMGSGQILQADLGPSLWTGEVTFAECEHAKARRIEVLLNAIIQRQGSFYLYDPRHRGPAEDMDGSILGSSAVKINSLPDAKSMSLKGLPSSYKLSAGDYLSFVYGSPGRRAFHEICEDITANSSGVTSAFDVNPVIRTGAAANDAVTLFKPAMKCIIRPDSLDIDSSNSLVSTQISFSVVQKI